MVTVRVLYELFSDDPSLCGAVCRDSSGFFDASVQVNVVASPEPATFWLLGAALMAVRALRGAKGASQL